MGVQVLGGRIENGQPWNTAGLTKPLWPLVSRPALTSLVSDFCGVEGSLFVELMRLPLPKTFCRSRNWIAKTPPGGGLGPAQLITRYRRGQSTP